MMEKRDMARKNVTELQRGDVIPFRSLVKSGRAVVLGIDVSEVMKQVDVVIVDADVPRDKFYLKKQRKTHPLTDQFDVVGVLDI